MNSSCWKRKGEVRFTRIHSIGVSFLLRLVLARLMCSNEKWWMDHSGLFSFCTFQTLFCKIRSWLGFVSIPILSKQTHPTWNMNRFQLLHLVVTLGKMADLRLALDRWPISTQMSIQGGQESCFVVAEDRSKMSQYFRALESNENITQLQVKESTI